jgi:hypothetical protein
MVKTEIDYEQISLYHLLMYQMIRDSVHREEKLTISLLQVSNHPWLTLKASWTKTASTHDWHLSLKDRLPIIDMKD